MLYKGIGGKNNCDLFPEADSATGSCSIQFQSLEVALLDKWDRIPQKPLVNLNWLIRSIPRQCRLFFRQWKATQTNDICWNNWFFNRHEALSSKVRGNLSEMLTSEKNPFPNKSIFKILIRWGEGAAPLPLPLLFPMLIACLIK